LHTSISKTAGFIRKYHAPGESSPGRNKRNRVPYGDNNGGEETSQKDTGTMCGQNLGPVPRLPPENRDYHAPCGNRDYLAPCGNRDYLAGTGTNPRGRETLPEEHRDDVAQQRAGSGDPRPT